MLSKMESHHYLYYDNCEDFFQEKNVKNRNLLIKSKYYERGFGLFDYVYKGIYYTCALLEVCEDTLFDKERNLKVSFDMISKIYE